MYHWKTEYLSKVKGLSHEELSSRSKTRIPDEFMESELAKKNIQDHYEFNYYRIYLSR